MSESIPAQITEEPKKYRFLAENSEIDWPKRPIFESIYRSDEELKSNKYSYIADLIAFLSSSSLIFPNLLKTAFPLELMITV